VRLYAESSAVLAWLLGEPRGEVARRVLAEAEVVLASELTLVECERVLIRAVALGTVSEAVAADRRAVLSRAATHWHLVRLAGEVLGRARRPFAHEPVRTLDALHLASALVGRSAAPNLALLSLDERVRANGEALGFELLPHD
jgi:predicted nucleic acid-binding protein